MNPEKVNQKWKILSLEELIINTPTFIPCLILTESHLQTDILDAEIQIKNYSLHRADRVNRRGGGTAIYTHDSIVISNIETFSDKHCQAVLIYNEPNNLIIIGAYRPPDTSLDSFKNLMTKIQNFINKYNKPDVYLLGDLNFPNIRWQDSTIKCGKSTEDNHSAQLLLDFMETHFMLQQVKENTRADKNILDVIIVNNDEYIHNIVVEKSKITSDHDLVKCELVNQFKNPTRINEPYKPTNEFDKYNWNKAKWDNIHEDMREIDWDQILNNESSVSEMCDTFQKTIISVASKHTVKHKLDQPKKHSHIPSDRLALIKRKKRLNSKINQLKYFKHPNKTTDQIENSIKLLQSEKEQIESAIKLSIQEEQRRKEASVLEKIKTNPKAFYTYANQKRKIKCRIGPLKNKAGKLHSNPKEMADILQSQYKTVFSDPETDTNINIETNNQYPGIDTIDFCEEDFIEAINLIPPNSASGPDKFPIKIIKECKHELAKPLYIIWKRSLETGEIPDKYLEQTIVPIFKKGSKSDPANYRPVSLTSHILKIFERIIRKRLVEYIDKNNIIVKEQYGFMHGKSCTTQLLSHFEKILEILDNNSNADVIYLDFAKAFDKVDHAILLKKLNSVGITGNLLTWLKSFLSNRKQYVIVENQKSIPEKVLSGVPQGTVLGPLLFILYINDIVKVIKHSYIKIFADDSKLIKIINSLEDRELLDEDLQAVIEWALKNKMELNRLKFQLLSHGNKENLKVPYKIEQNVLLEKSEDVKDLGVTLSENATFSTHIGNITTSAKRLASWTLRTFQSRSQEVVMLLYKTYVRPILEYSCALWSPHLIKDITAIEAIQRSITAKIEGLENLNYWERLKELNLYSLQRRRERYQIIHMYKIFKDIIPNELNLNFYETHRHGTMCKRPKLNLRNQRLSTLRNQYFTSIGPALFNSIPGYIKSSKSVNAFKNNLDTFLKFVPDTPPLPNYARQNNNSLLEWKAVGGGAQTDGGNTSASESTYDAPDRRAQDRS